MPNYSTLREALDAVRDYFRGKGLKPDPKPTEISEALQSLKENTKRLDDWWERGDEHFHHRFD
jgi:hypothetical protein